MSNVEKRRRERNIRAAIAAKKTREQTQKPVRHPWKNRPTGVSASGVPYIVDRHGVSLALVEGYFDNG
jgi:hypothetical protein